MKEFWDQRFSVEDYYYGKEPNPFFRQSIDSLRPGKVMLPAEGEGRNAVYAARQGWQAFAVDFSEAGRQKTMKLAQEFNTTVDYRLGDITEFDFGEEVYDAVGLIYAHLDPAYREEVHRKLVRSLKPGGYMILEAFNKRQLGNSSGGPKSEEMLYSKQILTEDFKDMEITELEEYQLHLDAGNGHQGEAEIIRLFARKIK
jgi:SAM-dependent methyltransferase